ncbi:hypothetical protein CYL16_16910 [Mycobacterium sp. EPG1]|nr:hypothetical protein CYL16_16910 [Mycobacterium sp. EPG1]
MRNGYDLGISEMLFRTSCISSECRTLGVVFRTPTDPQDLGICRDQNFRRSRCHHPPAARSDSLEFRCLPGR